MYTNIWTSTLVEKLATIAEPENLQDKYAVKVSEDNEVVGYIPKDLSKYCTSVFLRERTAVCAVIGKKRKQN